MSGCYGNHPIDRMMEQQLYRHLDEEASGECPKCGETLDDDGKCPECGYAESDDEDGYVEYMLDRDEERRLY